MRRFSLKDDAQEQLALWFDQACEADRHEPTAFSLATVSAVGQPSLRTVFFTNCESNKAMAIADNNKVSRLSFWLKLQRLTIIGPLPHQFDNQRAGDIKKQIPSGNS